MELKDLFNSKEIMDLFDEAGQKAHEIMVEQMEINPGAIDALYGP